MILLNEHNAIM